MNPSIRYHALETHASWAPLGAIHPRVGHEDPLETRFSPFCLLQTRPVRCPVRETHNTLRLLLYLAIPFMLLNVGMALELRISNTTPEAMRRSRTCPDAYETL